MRTLILTLAAIAALNACGQSEGTTAAPPSAQSASPVSDPSPLANAPVSAQAASVDVWATLSPETFRKLYDELAQANGDDTIKRMSKTKDGVAVVLSDTQFQRGVAEMKKLDLANGRFKSKLGIRLSIDSKGGVTKITVVGDRSDPINLMRFIGAVGVVNTMLNPGLDEKANTDFLATLGLMRGDDDPSVGQPVSSFNHGGAFQCVSMPSDQTTGVGCVVEPRS